MWTYPRMARHAVFSSLALALVGCGPSRSPRTSRLSPPKRVESGDPKDQHGPSPILVIRPFARTGYAPDSDLEVVCDLAVPTEGTMPEHVLIRIVDRQLREHTSKFASIRSSEGGGHYVLHVSLLTPKASGTYFLQARAIDRVVGKQGRDDTPMSSRMTLSQPAEILVR